MVSVNSMRNYWFLGSPLLSFSLLFHCDNLYSEALHGSYGYLVTICRHWSVS